MTQQTQENPFIGMAQALQPKHIAVRAVTGVVAAASPLVINADGLPLSGGDLRVNASLLARTVPITVEGRSGTAQLAAELTVGARVLLLTADGQIYDVICRVVEG